MKDLALLFFGAFVQWGLATGPGRVFATVFLGRRSGG